MLTAAHRVGTAPGTTTLYMPYSTASDLKDNLGLIYNDKYWYTGRSWPALGGADFGASISSLRPGQMIATPAYIVPGTYVPDLSTPWYKDKMSWLKIGLLGAAGYVSYKLFV